MSKTIQKHYLRIIRQWPIDALRPVSFQEAMRRRMTDRFIIPQTQPETNIEANEAQVSAPPRPDEKQEMEQVNALYSLLENRYADMYKTSGDLLHPAFKPSYYDDLMAEMEEAPKRSWLTRTWMRWSGIVRFK